MSERIWACDLLTAMPPAPRAIVARICEQHGLLDVNVLGPVRSPAIMACRMEIFSTLRGHRFQRREVAAWFNISAPKIRYIPPRPKRLEAA